MLTFESPFYEEEGIVVFRDHADPTLFHYLAGPPRLTRGDDGTPHLLLLKYRHALEALGDAGAPLREQLGGGFLMFGVDCGVSEERKGRIASALQARLPPGTGAVNLVPVLYSEGRVKVLALDSESAATETIEGEGDQPPAKFVRKVLGTSKPSLLQDQRAIFSLPLSVDGVALVEEAYQSDLSPIGVMYELEFAGLRPALAVKARVDLQRVYDKLSIELGVTAGGGGGGTTATAEGSASDTETERNDDSQGQAQTGAAIDIKLGMALETLREEGAIDIEIVRQQSGDAVGEMEKRAMDLLKESVLNRLFQPTMTTQQTSPQQTAQQLQQATSRMVNQGQSGNQQQQGGGNVQIGFELKYLRREELKTVDYDYRVQAPETRTHAPNGFFSALVGGTEKAEHLREVDLDDAFFKVLDVAVSTTADFAGLGLQALIVQLQYGGTVAAPAVAADVVLTPAESATRHFRAFLDLGDLSWRYRLEYKFGDGDGIEAATASRSVGWREETGRALVVHPPDDLDLLRLVVEPGRVDWDLVEQIATELVYEHPESDFRATATFLFDRDSGAERWTVRLPEGAPRAYTVKHTWHLAGGNRVVGEPEPRSERRVFVNDPFVDRLPIIVDPQIDPAEVQRITVEIHYEDADNGLEVRRTVELVSPELRATTVPIPIVDPKKRTYSWRARLVKAGGQLEDRPLKETDALTIALTPGGFYLDVQVALLGDMGALSVTAVQVDLKTEPLDGQPQKVESVLFLPGEDVRRSQRLLIRADREASFQHKVQVFLADGRVIERDWAPHASRILPVPLAALVRE